MLLLRAGGISKIPPCFGRICVTCASGTVTLTGTAEHAEKVEIKIDSGLWKLAQGTSSWSYTLDTTDLDNGKHTVYVRAYSDGKYSEIESFTIDVDNQQSIIEGVDDELLCLGAVFIFIILVVFAITRRR